MPKGILNLQIEEIDTPMAHEPLLDIDEDGGIGDHVIVKVWQVPGTNRLVCYRDWVSYRDY